MDYIKFYLIKRDGFTMLQPHSFLNLKRSELITFNTKTIKLKIGANNVTAGNTKNSVIGITIRKKWVSDNSYFVLTLNNAKKVYVSK